MILVDSSVWIDFFRARETPQTAFLKANLTRTRLSTADLVLTEVLQGTAGERAASNVQRLLLTLNLVVVGGTEVAVQAAQNYRRLRTLGITVRSTIDVLIATRCIIDDRQLLHSDRDFNPFVEHLGLRLAPTDFFGVH